MYANSFACKQSENAINNHFWRRATIRGQHSQLITSRDPFNFRHIISQQAVLLVTFADTLLGYHASIPHRENKLFQPTNILSKYTQYANYREPSIFGEPLASISAFLKYIRNSFYCSPSKWRRLKNLSPNIVFI